MRIIKLVILLCIYITFFISTSQCQWVKVMEYSGNITSFLAYSHTPGGADLFASSVGGGLFFSTDYGENWSVKGLTDTSVLCLASSAAGANIFAGMNGQGISKSDNYGVTWTTYNNGLITDDDKTVRALVTTPNGLGGINVFAGTDGGVFLSTNYGESWINKDLLYVQALAISEYGVGGVSLYAASTGNGVFVSTDNGTNWKGISSGLSYGDISVLSLGKITSGDTTLFAASYGHYLFHSTNNGANWFTIDYSNGLTKSWIWTVVVCPDAPENVFAGTNGGVFLSTDNGTSWTSVGLTNNDVKTLVITDDGAGGKYLFAGTYNNGGIWRRPLADMVTSVQGSNNDIPKEFELVQNYPNPTNPSSTITFYLPEVSHVTLNVFNTLGQQVALLVDAQYQPGRYEVQFDGSNLTSGVYFYRIVAGEYTQTKKMVLIK
jgi:hypothetical protein